MKVQFNNMIQVERIRDALGFEWNKTGKDCLQGHSHKEIDGVKLIAVNVFKVGASKWEDLVDQTIRDDGQVTMRIKEHAADNYINNFVLDNVFHGFIPSDIEVDRERTIKVKMGPGKVAKKVTKIVMAPGFLYGKMKIVDMEQDVKTGDYIITIRPQHIDTPVS